mmetsp:Transcript_15417/g.39349  ORF Transcript_15417/g.39349 Transcript_15417/m.39349 type:complete len:86 (+) Transcript_15417:1016-1273(+)
MMVDSRATTAWPSSKARCTSSWMSINKCIPETRKRTPTNQSTQKDEKLQRASNQRMFVGREMIQNRADSGVDLSPKSDVNESDKK